MKRGLLIIAVAAMLVLAGCNSGSTDGTATPGANNTTDAGPSMPSDVSTLDGINESAGVYNGSAMFETHFESLNTNDTHYVETTRFSRDSGTVSFTFTNGTDGDSFVLTNETTGDRQAYWAGESLVATRNESKSPPVTIAQGNAKLASNYGFVSALIRMVPYATLVRTNVSTAGTDTIDGEPMYRFSVDGYNNSESGASFTLFQNATAVTGSVFVDSDGFVRAADLTATIESGGEEETVVMNYSVSELGSATAPKPDWVSGYPTASVSTTADGKVLALTLQDGESIPAGTTVEVTGSWRSYGNVTLEESLAPGETLYAVASGGFGGTSADAQVGQQPSVPDDAASIREDSIGVVLTVDGKELQYAPPEN